MIIFVSFSDSLISIFVYRLFIEVTLLLPGGGQRQRSTPFIIQAVISHHAAASRRVRARDVLTVTREVVFRCVAPSRSRIAIHAAPFSNKKESATCDAKQAAVLLGDLRWTWFGHAHARSKDDDDA